MAKFKRGRSNDASDGEMEEQDYEVPKVKKAKMAKVATAPIASKKNEKGEPYWELSSSTRRVTVTKFGYGKNKDTLRVDIREFYEKDGEQLPGKKGISLSVEQFNALLRSISSIKAMMIKEGVPVENVAAESIAVESIERARTSGLGRAGRPKPSKSNIEATSDEEEEEEEEKEEGEEKEEE